MHDGQHEMHLLELFCFTIIMMIGSNYVLCKRSETECVFVTRFITIVCLGVISSQTIGPLFELFFQYIDHHGAKPLSDLVQGCAHGGKMIGPASQDPVIFYNSFLCAYLY